ncbi:hypothetical protein AAMO2058_000726300 [Amorphochlora amoebiformis]
MSEDYFSTIPNGYKPVVEYAWEGKQSCKQIAALMLDFSKAIKSCGQDLEKRVTSHPLPPSAVGSTLKKAVGSITTAMQKMAMVMQECAQKMDADRDAYIDFRHKQSTSKRDGIKTFETSKKELEKARSYMNYSKKQYDNQCRKAEKAIQARNDAKASSDPKLQSKLPKLNQNAIGQVVKAKEAEVTYSKSVNSVRKHQVNHRNTTYKVLNSMQDLERARIIRSTQSIKMTSDAVLRIAEVMKSDFDVAAKQISAINPSQDLAVFLEKAKTESKLSSVEPLVLVEYRHHGIFLLDQEGVKSTFVARNFAKPPTPGVPKPMSTSLPANNGAPPPLPGESLTSMPTPVQKLDDFLLASPTLGDTKGGKGPPTAPAGSRRPPPSGPREISRDISPSPPPPPLLNSEENRVSHPSTKSQDAAIDKAALALPPLPPGGPKPNVPGPPPPAGAGKPPSKHKARPSQSEEGLRKIKQLSELKNPSKERPIIARVDFEFVVEEENDLGFNVGQYVIVKDRSDPEWWTGSVVGDTKVGEFPSNYVTVVQDPANGMLKQAKALFEYNEAEEGDLCFKKDHIIDVLDDSHQGWWEGMIGNKTGRFPSNYTVIIPSKGVTTARLTTGR